MKAFIIGMLALLVAMPAFSQGSIGGKLSTAGSPGYIVNFDSSNAVGTYVLGASATNFIVNFNHTGAFVGVLYDCDTMAYVASSCDTITALASDVSKLAYTSGRAHLMIVISTAAAGTEISTLVVKGSYSASGGGPTTDADGNGLYEFAYLWDADGDGSSKVTCTAKDAPDPACKVEGEVIYRDFADDVNCAMHGCGFGQMDLTGTIYLEPIIYVNWPCWDARERVDFNDPTATNDSLHSSTAGLAYTRDCPATPDTESGRRFITIATLGWQGSVVGGGTDTRNPATTANYKRDTGTYIVDDRGPSHKGDGDNLWFGFDGFIRGINFGYFGSLNATPNTAAISGEYASDGDSKGFGPIEGNQTIAGMAATICVIDDATVFGSGVVSADGWAASLVAGDQVTIGASSSGIDEIRTRFVYRVRDVPSSTCNGAGTLDIPLGGRVASGTAAASFGSNLAFTGDVYGGRFVVANRSDAILASATMSNFTIEPQDWWNEIGGDCATTGLWDLTTDSASADYDCDTNPLFGMYGPGTNRINNVVVRNWHDRAIDGATQAGSTQIEDIYFLYGNGGPISDPGYGWNFLRTEIRDTQFSGTVIASFGPAVSLRQTRVVNSTFSNFMKPSVGWKYSSVIGLELVSSAFDNAFFFLCGASYNTIEDVKISGHYSQNGGSSNGVVARFVCADTSNPTRGNTMSNVRLEGPGAATGGSLGSSCAIVFDSNTVDGADQTAAAVGNHFEDFRYMHQDINQKSSLFCAQDDTVGDPGAGGSREFENSLWRNTFANSRVDNIGTGTDAQVYRACGRAAGTNACNTAIEGSASSGVTNDPRGCMNSANGAAPAIEACN